MNRNVYLMKHQDKIFAAVKEEDRIVELSAYPDFNGKRAPQLGDIYIGKVKNIVPNIGAAFIEILPGMECYYSLLANKEPFFTSKKGKKPLCIGDELMVQIETEGVKTKVPTVTSKFTMQGKYVAVTYGDLRVGVSKKLSKEMREAYQLRIADYENEQYGVIVRTNAQTVEPEVVLAELNALTQQMESLLTIGKMRTCFTCLLENPSPYLSLLRNINQEGLCQIVVEDEALYQEAAQYLETRQPEDFAKLKRYESKSLPLHKMERLEHTLGSALSEKVWLKSGAYLVIQPTEALTVIDVNSGKAVSKKKNPAEAFWKINLEAAKEIAYQLRLRNISGIVIIDFINLNQKEEQKELLRQFNQELKKDTIPAYALDITKLSLVEVTRKKTRRSLREMMQD